MSDQKCSQCGAVVDAAATTRGRCAACGHGLTTPVVIGEQLADPRAKTVTNMSVADLIRASEVDHGAVTLSLGDQITPERGEAPGALEAPTVTADPQRAQTQQASPAGAAASTGALRRYQDGAFVTMSGAPADATGERAEVFELPYAAGDVVMRIAGYDILGELGRGGMGVVYKAYSLRLCRMVALKMMTSGRHASQAELIRFQNEAMLAARLTHPNIVPVFDAGEHEGNFFFVMAFVAGSGFGDLIAKGTPEALEHGVQVLAKVARALDYAHRVGIVHRDIKPDNVLVDEAGEPQITDFGIAKNVRREVSITKSGATLGTPAYMAPEQANTVLDKIGPLTDVYSLGATMYHLLTGRPPFDGPNAMSILLAVLEKEPDPPRAVAKKTLGRDLDPDLATICLKAMEKGAQDRYASAGAMADDLEAWLGDHPIAARPIGAAERLQKLVRRNRAAFVGVLIAFMTLAMITVGFGVVLAFNVERTSDSLRDNDMRAGVDQALTLERAIIVNMKQGRADVVRELVGELRKDDKITRIEVVRPDRSLAYTDLRTRKAVAARVQRESTRAFGERTQPEFMATGAVEMLERVALKRIDAAGAPAVAPRFDYDDTAWRELIAANKTVTRVEEVDGVPHLTVLKPIVNGGTCQVCHGEVAEAAPDGDPKPSSVYDYGGYDYGDAGDTKKEGAEPYDPDNRIRAVLVVRRSQAEVEAQIADNTQQTLVIGAATAGGFLLLLLAITKLFGIRLRPRRYGRGR